MAFRAALLMSQTPIMLMLIITCNFFLSMQMSDHPQQPELSVPMMPG